MYIYHQLIYTIKDKPIGDRHNSYQERLAYELRPCPHLHFSSFESAYISLRLGLLSTLRARFFVHNSGIGMVSTECIRISTLKQLYYSLIYSHFSYGIIILGNTYTSTLQPLFILQKRVLRIMTFANYDSHYSTIFRQLELLKIYDLVFIHTALFMQQYYSKQLPETFDNLFQPLSCKHNYNTRLASKTTTTSQKHERTSANSM